MVEYRTNSIGIGCVLVLSVRGTHEGELTIEELEEIDDVMEVKEAGENFEERIRVNTTQFDTWVRVDYAIQKSLHSWDISNKEERLGIQTVLDDPRIIIDVETVEFVERVKEDG